MISLSKVLQGKPILITQGIYFYQPTIEEIEDMTERIYWEIVNLWMIKRKDIVSQETDETRDMDDFDIWKLFIFSNEHMRRALFLSCKYLLRSKVEFFEISGTIYIGEKGSGLILDNTFYLLMKELCEKVTPSSSASEEDKSQYQETENMSERERQMIEKMKASEKKIEEAKNPNKKPEDNLGNRILGLVAVGNYTFEQVYKMTMLQFNMLLQKYIEIQTFEIRSVLSPYMSSEDNQNSNKFWLD